MSIVAYTGLPGSGKSYGVVANVILPALDNGRTVWTNIPLQHDAINERFPGADVEVFDVQTMMDRPEWVLDTVPEGAVFVLDEVWRVWPAGIRPADIPQAYKQFLAEHRHRVGDDGYSTEIVIVTQDLAQIATFARDLTEKTFIAKKMDALGSSKRFRVDVYTGMIKGPQGPEARKVNSLHGKYEQKIYSLYQSHTQSKTGSAGLEAKPDKRATVWRNPFIRYGVPAAIILAVLASYRVVKLFDPDSDSNLAGGSNPTEQSARQPGGATVGRSRGVPANRRPAKPTLPRVSQTWRLAGVIRSRDYERAYLVSNTTSRVIGLQNCDQFEDTGEWYCYINGQRVTYWSAPQLNRDNNNRPRLTNALTAS